MLETKDIDRYFDSKTLDNISIEKSSYGPVWSIVNTKFKEFQKEHRRIKNEERNNSMIINGMRRFKKFLRR